IEGVGETEVRTFRGPAARRTDRKERGGDIPRLATSGQSADWVRASDISPTPSAFFYQSHVDFFRAGPRGAPTAMAVNRWELQEFGLTGRPRSSRRLTGMRRPSSLHSTVALAWISNAEAGRSLRRLPLGMIGRCAEASSACTSQSRSSVAVTQASAAQRDRSNGREK